jgi:hypothetical protein
MLSGSIQFAIFAIKNKKRASAPFFYSFGRLRRLVELLNISSGALISPDGNIVPARLRGLVKMARPERFELPTLRFVA